MNAIHHIKSGDLKQGKTLLLQAATHLFDLGAEIIVTGCTEISLVLKNNDIEIPIVDPLEVIAKYSVEIALGKTISP